MQLKQDSLEKKFNNAQQKEESKVYAKTWEDNAVPETHDPIAKLERPKQVDGTLDYLEMLRAERDCVYAELGKSEEAFGKRKRKFNMHAPSYDGNPKKVFKWCEKLEAHLDNYEWEQIPNV